MTTYTEAIILAEQCLQEAQDNRDWSSESAELWDGFIQGIECVIRRLEANDPYYVPEGSLTKRSDPNAYRLED